MTEQDKRTDDEVFTSIRQTVCLECWGEIQGEQSIGDLCELERRLTAATEVAKAAVALRDQMMNIGVSLADMRQSEREFEAAVEVYDPYFPAVEHKPAAAGEETK